MLERHVCPRCEGDGVVTDLVVETFDAVDAHHPAVLEVPCPTCGARMDADRDEWRCPICHTTRPLDREGLVDRMTGEYESAGYDRPGRTECPVCGERAVRCGPDGERVCQECDAFYVGRFSTGWFAYARWLRWRGDVEVVDR